MGCCTSSTAKRSEDTRRPPPHTHKGTHVAAGKVLAPPDEETVVKEVLSETPISKPPPPPPPPQPPTHHLHQQQQQQQRDSHIVPILHPQQPPRTQQPQLPQNFVSTRINNDDDNNDNVNVNRRKTEQREEKTPEISQASEICSVTDTLSTATTTTTVTEIRDDEATSKKRVVNRSPGKVPRKRPYTGDRVSKQPARGERSAAAGRREVSRGATNGIERRDMGEGSGRRSRSPATRVAGGVGRGRRVGSPAKVTGRAGSRLVDREVNKKEERNDGVSVEQQPNESLENPLVSLECFIFL